MGLHRTGRLLCRRQGRKGCLAPEREGERYGKEQESQKDGEVGGKWNPVQLGVTKERFLKGDASGSGYISARYNPSLPLGHLLPFLTAYSQLPRKVCKPTGDLCSCVWKSSRWRSFRSSESKHPLVPHTYANIKGTALNSLRAMKTESFHPFYLNLKEGEAPVENLRQRQKNSKA